MFGVGIAENNRLHIHIHEARESVEERNICKKSVKYICTQFPLMWISTDTKTSPTTVCFYSCSVCVSLSPSSLIYPLTVRVVGAPQMISQPVSFIFPCSQLPSGTWRTPGLSIPWWCLPTSSSVYLVYFPLSLNLGRWFWPDLINGRHDHTTAVCVSLRWSRGLHVVWLPPGSWHGLPRL